MNTQFFKEKYGLYTRKIESYRNKARTIINRAEKALNDKKINKYIKFKERLVSKYLLKKNNAIDQLENYFGHFNDVKILPSKLLSNSKKFMRVVMQPLKN